MRYLKRNTKYSILAFLIIVLSRTISISTLAKTEVYPACACLHADRFYLYDNPQILSTTSLKSEVQIININTVSQDELIKILKISEPLACKINALRNSLSGEFKDPKDLLQLSELTNLEWKEGREKRG
ncbi:MAG: helix-hairpin-helix domain-containing protein [Atribacterota bacterium]|nr:helix-hairpin-helix domain-containing protein [Atribacterota bacterium]